MWERVPTRCILRVGKTGARMTGGASVYVITHLPTLRHYVGKARNVKTRWKQHLRCTAKRRSHIQKALAKYGEAEFVCQEVERFETDDEAYKAEAWWVEFLRANVEGFNLSAGGEGNPEFDVTDEFRAKMSAAGRKAWENNEERRKLVSDWTKANHTGMKRSAETCERIGASHRGKPLSPEWRKKISESSKGKPRQYISDLFKGVPKKPEHVAKIAAAHRGMKRSEQARANMRAGWARRLARLKAKND
jgi:group I intron endonuclease